MENCKRFGLYALVLAALMIVVAVPSIAQAQTDEIQVYTGELAPVGVFNLTLHNNYTPDGLKEPAFPGANTSDKSLNGVPEWAYGVTPWFEAGLYLPRQHRQEPWRGPQRIQAAHSVRGAARRRPHVFLRGEFRVQRQHGPLE